MVFEQEFLKVQLKSWLWQLWEQAKDGDAGFVCPVTFEKKSENEAWISEQLNAIQTRISLFPRNKQRRKAWSGEAERLILSMLASESMVSMGQAMSQDTMKDFVEHIKIFLGRLKAFDKKLTLPDIGQALRNYLVYAVFRELNGQPQSCTPAIFGYSMLYPYTDNYLDRRDISDQEKERYNQMIAAKIQNTTMKGEPGNIHAKKTKMLLDMIESCYPRDKETEIYQGLYLMLKAQADSQRQYDPKDTFEEEGIFDISVMKGGLSVLIDRYLTAYPMTGEDVLFYFGFGFLLQLCDDLQDIGEDKKDGSSTLFSSCEDGEETDRQVKRLLCLVRSVFLECPAPNKKTVTFVEECCCLLILTSAAGSREHLSKAGIKWVEERLPFSLHFLDEINRQEGISLLAENQNKAKQLMYSFVN